MQLVRRKRPRPVVPIIALIDILAILLIFFIATMTFRTPRSVLPINLPSTDALPATEIHDTRLELSVREDGSLFLQDDPVDLAELAPRLLAAREDNPDIKLELRADRELPIGLLISVWDALATAGFPIRDVPTRVTRGTAPADPG